MINNFIVPFFLSVVFILVAHLGAGLMGINPDKVVLGGALFAAIRADWKAT